MSVHLALALATAVPAGCYSSFGGEPKSGAPEKKAPPPKRTPAKLEQGKENKEPEQSYAEAWRVICHAKRLSGGEDSQIADWIVQNLKNEKARYWFIGLGNVKRENKLAHFMGEAKRAGFESCPSAAILFPAGPSSRPAVR